MPPKKKSLILNSTGKAAISDMNLRVHCFLKKEGQKERRREGGRKERKREGGRKEGRKEGKEGGREGGREEGRKEDRNTYDTVSNNDKQEEVTADSSTLPCFMKVWFMRQGTIFGH